MAGRPGAPVLIASRLGRRAEAILQGSDRFTVTALFTRSLYLEDQTGGLVCLLRDDAENGPLHVHVRDWPDGGGGHVREGAFVRRCRRSLVLDGMAVDFSGAAVWHAPAFPDWERQRAQAGVKQLLAVAAGEAPEETMASFVLNGRDAPDEPMAQALVTRVTRGLEALERYCTRSDGPHQAPTDLLGLGPGLTPTGDDVLAGLFLAAHAVREVEKLTPLRTALQKLLAVSTNHISAAHLTAAMEGEAIAVFHEILNTTLAGGENVTRVMPRLGKVGHSSGWDGLLGIITGLRIFLGAT